MRAVLVVSAFMIATFAWAAQSVPLSLPPVDCADTEVTTNVVVSGWQRGAEKFTFSLSCIASPSNNVEAAFGEDVNTNGVLEPEETDFPALGEESPVWLYRREWNLMRLTGRGLYNSGETFTVGTPLDPTAILFR